ncbi:MAG: hypothetical protein U5K36_13670 [Roseovarius sp.]|nr:hypothetical protein [Roseovarius sp.]
MLERLVAAGHGGLRVRRLGGDRAGEMRITRFLRNPAVTVREIVATARARVCAAAAGRDVLVIQDTTVTRSEGGGGSYLHAAIAVDAGSGAVLGPVAAEFLQREGGQRRSRRQRPPEARESARWLRVCEAASGIGGAARVTVVAATFSRCSTAPRRGLN